MACWSSLDKIYRLTPPRARTDALGHGACWRVAARATRRHVSCYLCFCCCQSSVLKQRSPAQCARRLLRSGQVLDHRENTYTRQVRRPAALRAPARDSAARWVGRPSERSAKSPRAATMTNTWGAPREIGDDRSHRQYSTACTTLTAAVTLQRARFAVAAHGDTRHARSAQQSDRAPALPSPH